MISMAAAELGFVGERALASLRTGDIAAYDRWSTIAGRLVDQLAAGLDGRPVAATGPRCETCGAAMAPPIARAHPDCAVCRAAGGLW